MDLDTGLALVRVLVGLTIAAHGTQKALGMFGGGGAAGTTGMVDKLGFRPASLWAWVLSWAELGGGVALAAGLLTGIAAGALVVDMVVAIWKVHWPKGFFVSAGGLEYNLVLAALLCVFGVAGPAALALDSALGVAQWTTALFAGTLVLGLLGVWAGQRPQVARIEEHRRRAA